MFHSGHIEPSWGKKEPKLNINRSNCGTFMWFYGFCIDRKSKMAAKADHVFGIEPNDDGKMF